MPERSVSARISETSGCESFSTTRIGPSTSTDLIGRDLAFHAGGGIGHHVHEVELHRLGIERHAVMEFHAVSDVQDDRRGIAKLPGLRQFRFGLQGGEVDVDQGVEHRPEKGVVGAVGAGRGVEPRWIGIGRDTQDSAGLLLGRTRNLGEKRAAACRRGRDRKRHAERGPARHSAYAKSYVFVGHRRLSPSCLFSVVELL